MPFFVVTRKLDGAEVYRYLADTPIEWDGMSFESHNHVEVQQDSNQQASGIKRLTKLQFISLLGDDFSNILAAARVNVEVEKFVRMLDWATPDADGTSIDLSDHRTISSLQALESMGIISAGRSAEILGGV